MTRNISRPVARYLEKLYFTPKSIESSGGAKSLYEAVKKDGKYALTLRDIKEWLRGVESYSPYHHASINFPTSYVITGRLFEMGDTDLMDMVRYFCQND